MPERLVVIGADAAGMSAASQARRQRGPDDLQIVAFDRGNFSSYSACGIPYYVGGVVDELDALVARTPEEFRDNHAVDVHLRHEVTRIDLDEQFITVCDLEHGSERTERYDHLMIATGATPIRPPLPGIDANGVFGIQTLDDGLAVHTAIRHRQTERAVVVGGGYIGLEMAEALCLLGIETHLVDASPYPMTTLDPDMGGLVADALEEFGITLHLDQPVSGFETAESAVTAVVTEQETVPADLVILGLGVRPNAKLAKDAGLAIGPSGGVVVDRRMRASRPNVWAAGDCAEKFHRISGDRVAIALGTHANKEGRAAGTNIGGGYATFPGVIGTAATKVCELEVARTGLTESEAERAGFVTRSTTMESSTRAGYYPGASRIVTKLIYEERSGRLLGAQIVGREGAAKRIDVLALALWNGMSVDELMNVDLSYAPPYAPVWDPVLITARRAAEDLRRAT